MNVFKSGSFPATMLHNLNHLCSQRWELYFQGRAWQGWLVGVCHLITAGLCPGKLLTRGQFVSRPLCHLLPVLSPSMVFSPPQAAMPSLFPL